MLTATARSMWFVSHPTAGGACDPRVDGSPIAGWQRDAVERVGGEHTDRAALGTLEALGERGGLAPVCQHEDVDARGDAIHPGVEQRSDADPHVELLGDLARHALLRRLAGLELAARQLPLPSRVVHGPDEA